VACGRKNEAALIIIITKEDVTKWHLFNTLCPHNRQQTFLKENLLGAKCNHHSQFCAQFLNYEVL
jgi:hypothetical protein